MFESNKNPLRTPNWLYVWVIVIFTLAASIMIVAVFLITTVVMDVSDRGLRPVIEELWCGPDVHCLFPPDVPMSVPLPPTVE
jgi:hypothetical protein